MDAVVKKIVIEVKKGNQQAFSELVELYKDKVYQIAYRMLGNVHEAQDVAQEAFLRAYVNIESYDTNRKFSTWLFRIATNLAIDRIRKKKPDFHLEDKVAGTEDLDYYSQFATEDKLPEEKVVQYETQDWVQKEIMALPPKYRSAIILKYIEDLSLKEISNILNLPVATVKTRIHRGREALRKRLRET
ncbi:RNA polymerase sigma factor SigW [Evansella cellulosilytica]|uniref:RNA polymerase sigma factor n=1 Tax=Evansella cellulosilytica (strain ATCC 21833 / DSM 2522 / FERM P-1141 / JCM 9156 / N-4) TaxID=649639 RepID=E6TTB7_EVAC2|nr:RNA polymerase sigma factor SigW [Evansella cellulosilytica]ADU28457.1 RNA polymerase, sigma-24 subunit, ECF subfamily [Evansella cellulosilytica DSM 2522]